MQIPSLASVPDILTKYPLKTLPILSNVKFSLPITKENGIPLIKSTIYLQQESLFMVIEQYTQTICRTICP